MMPDFKQWKVTPAEGNSATGAIGQGYWVSFCDDIEGWWQPTIEKANELCKLLNDYENEVQAFIERDAGEDL